MDPFGLRVAVGKYLDLAAKFCLKQAVFKLKEKASLSNGTCGSGSSVLLDFLCQSLSHTMSHHCAATKIRSLLTNFAQALEYRDTHTRTLPCTFNTARFPESCRNKTVLHAQKSSRRYWGMVLSQGYNPPIFDTYAGLHLRWIRTLYHNHGPQSPTHHRSHGWWYLSLSSISFSFFSLLNFLPLRWSYTPKQLYIHFPICYTSFFQLWF